MRRFVLDLAVHGWLVEQDLTDEPTSELLKRIATENNRLVEFKKIGKLSAAKLLKRKYISFSFPSSWTWVQIVELDLINPGNQFPNDYSSASIFFQILAKIVRDMAWVRRSAEGDHRASRIDFARSL